jgi:hypothetical protein
MARLREAFETSDLPIVVDVIAWAQAGEGFQRAVAPDLEVVLPAEGAAGGAPGTTCTP